MVINRRKHNKFKLIFVLASVLILGLYSLSITSRIHMDASPISEVSQDFGSVTDVTFSIDSISAPYIDTDTNYIDITYTTSGGVLVLLFPPGGGGYISFDSNLFGATTKTENFALTQGDKITPDAGEYQVVVYSLSVGGQVEGNKVYDSLTDIPAIRNNLTFSGVNLSVSTFEYEIDNTFGKVKGINVSIENSGDLAAFGDHSRVFLKNATYELDDGWELSARVNLPPGQTTQLLQNVETESVYPGTYDLVLRVIDFANLLLLDEVLVNDLTITGTLLPGDVPTDYENIFNFTNVDYPDLFGMANWLNITFDQSERIYLWLYDPSGRGQMVEKYSVSYPITNTATFCLTDGDRQEVSPGTWTWVATTSDNAIFYSDFITPIENGTIEIQGHNTTLGTSLNYTMSDGWITDFSVPARNMGDVYSFALEILLEFKPTAGPSQYYSYYSDYVLPPDGSWVDLNDNSSTFVITDVSPGDYEVNVIVWDLSFEIIATDSYNITITTTGNGSEEVGIDSLLSILLAVGIVILIKIHLKLINSRKFSEVSLWD